MECVSFTSGLSRGWRSPALLGHTSHLQYAPEPAGLLTWGECGEVRRSSGYTPALRCFQRVRAHALGLVSQQSTRLKEQRRDAGEHWDPTW
ncbi:hypothetical protein AAFF_G00082250 [Aldrovandia affinis]|uniref:Uncharacterized protein n=1 Tax=Aldrovandia affinis TaxID=143900 RepID=A0AAD7T4C8_9TELE|nr:hypothetical protein AAFF_G00082250 [Aldrovandia affinis]